MAQSMFAYPETTLDQTIPATPAEALQAQNTPLKLPATVTERSAAVHQFISQLVGEIHPSDVTVSNSFLQK